MACGFIGCDDEISLILMIDDSILSQFSENNNTAVLNHQITDNIREQQLPCFLQTCILISNYPIYQLHSHQNFSIVSSGCTIHLLSNSSQLTKLCDKSRTDESRNWYMLAVLHATRK